MIINLLRFFFKFNFRKNENHQFNNFKLQNNESHLSIFNFRKN